MFLRIDGAIINNIVGTCYSEDNCVAMVTRITELKRHSKKHTSKWYYFLYLLFIFTSNLYMVIQRLYRVVFIVIHSNATVHRSK